MNFSKQSQPTMGNTNGASKFERTGAITDLQLLGKSTSIRWGELLEMRNNKNNQLIFLQEKYLRDLESCKKTIERCNKASMSTHPNIVSLYGCAGDEIPDKFTNMYKACIFFEHVSANLKSEIRNRINASVPPNLKASQFAIPSSHYFKDAEFSHMISQFVDGLHFLQDNDVHIGDITPDVCFLSNNTTIKLLDKTLIYGGVSSFEIARRGGSHVFLTPIELENLRNHVEEEPYQDRFKADVFRLGMTLLECATLQKSSQLYDFNNYKIDLDLLSTRLVKVKERYSPFIYDLLREMLRFEEYRRPDFMDLQADIARHHNTAGKKEVGTPKKSNIIINNNSTPSKKGSFDVTPPKSRKQKELSQSCKTPDSGVRKSVTSMGPKLFMSNSPNPQIDPTIRKQSSVNLPKKNQFDLPVPLGAGHSKKRSRILNSECEIMDTGADLSKIHGVPYVMEGKESSSPSFRPEKQIVESSIKLIPKQIESENSLDDGKESGSNSDASQHFRTPLNREIRRDHNNDSSTEYQVTFGKNSAPSTRRQSNPWSNKNQWNIVPIQISQQKSPDQSFEGAFSLLHSQAQSRRNSAYGQSKPKHRSHLSMDGSKMMYHQPSPARSDHKTEYYSAYSNSIGSRLNISHESGQQDASGNKPAVNLDGSNKGIAPRKSHLGFGDETPEQFSSKPPVYQEKEPIGNTCKRVFNSQIEPSPLSSSTTFQQQNAWPPSLKHERPQRNSGHFYQGSVDFGKLGLYQQPPTVSAPLVNEKEEPRLGRFAAVPTPSFGAKRVFIEEPNLRHSLQNNDKDPNAAHIKRHKESVPKFDEARNSVTDNKDVDVDARFKMAMERSKRSTGYIMNITQKMGAKSHSRSSSIDAGALNLPVGTMPKLDIFGANSRTIHN